MLAKQVSAVYKYQS